MLKIRNVSQVWVHIPHDGDYGFRHFISFLIILYFYRVLYHFLDMAAVFGNN